MKFSNIINVSLIYATFRASTPIIYAALCAAITQQANILNVGTEGIMLMGAFMAVAISYTTGSWMLGVLAAMLSGMFMPSATSATRQTTVPSVWASTCWQWP